MAYSNDPQPDVYAHIPSMIPNIDFPLPYWINKLADMLLIGCTNPDLALVALAVPAALKAGWTVLTPSTKQLIEQTTGRSWLCGSKQIINAAEWADPIAADGLGGFVYGMFAGVDIAAYHAFFVSSGAEGVLDYIQYAKKFARNCSGSQSQWRGLVSIGGWPYTGGPSWGTGPEFLNSAGTPVGPLLVVNAGKTAIFTAWCSFSGLGLTGGVVCDMRLRDWYTGNILSEGHCDNIADPGQKAIVQYASPAGVEPNDMYIMLEVSFPLSLDNRIVTNEGGAYIRSFDYHSEEAPPFFNMKSMLKSSNGS